MLRSTIAAGVAATSAFCLVAASPAYAARPIVEHWTDHIEHIEQVEHAADDWCPDVPFDVLYTEDSWGTFTFGQRGDGNYYGGSTFNIEFSWTNVETGRTYSAVSHGTERDVHITDNGDGTITIEAVHTGPTTYFVDDGTRFIDVGRNFFEIVIDINGTPENPDDDDFVEFIGADFRGHADTADRDFCADIMEFLG